MGRSYEEYAREKAEREWKDKVKKRKETMSPQQVLDTVTKWKDIGNKKLTAGNLGEAESYYREALEYMLDVSMDAKQATVRDASFLALHSNLALLAIKQERWADAVASAESVLQKDPEHKKALYRRALARLRGSDDVPG